MFLYQDTSRYIHMPIHIASNIYQPLIVAQHLLIRYIIHPSLIRFPSSLASVRNILSAQHLQALQWEPTSETYKDTAKPIQRVVFLHARLHVRSVNGALGEASTE